MLLINLAEHTEAVFVLNEPDLLCEDLSMQKEDATVVIAGTDQSLVKTKKDRRDQWFFFPHQSAGLTEQLRSLLPFFGLTQTNFSLHNST